jgi:hypothetical protein
MRALSGLNITGYTGVETDIPETTWVITDYLERQRAQFFAMIVHWDRMRKPLP